MYEVSFVTQVETLARLRVDDVHLHPKSAPAALVLAVGELFQFAPFPIASQDGTLSPERLPSVRAVSCQGPSRRCTSQ